MTIKSLQPQFSIVIPVYNSVEALPVLLSRIATVFEDQIEAPFELVFVDDCSSNPETWKMLASLAENHPCARALQLTRNFGRTGAVLAGIEHACGKQIVIMDDDLQHRPEDIPKLIARRGHDVVLAQFENKAHGLVARAGSRAVSWLEHLVLRFPKNLHNSPFLLIRGDIAKHMLQCKTPYPFLPAMFLDITHDVVGVSVNHDRRHSGETGFSFFKRLRHFSNFLINNSALLLRGVAVVGTLMSLASFSYGCYLLLRGPGRVPGWTSLMIVTLIIGGLVLMSLGIAGEYLIRIIRGIESRPSYVVRTQLGDIDEIESNSKNE